MHKSSAAVPREVSRLKATVITTIAIAVMWLSTVIIGVLAVPVLFGYAGAIVWLARRRRGRLHAALLVSLCPLTVFFAQGVISYTQGTATLQFMGLPGTEFHNVDPQWRCGRQTGGCLVTGGEWMWEEPNNLAVQLMIRMFGPMPGSYTGPYPTKEEALAAVANGEILAPAALASGEFTVNGQPVRLDTDVGHDLLRIDLAYEMLLKDSQEQFVKDMLDELGPIKMTLWQSQCLIIRIPQSRNTPSAMIVLIDRETGRPFAYYAEGQYFHHFPPVPWQR